MTGLPSHSVTAYLTAFSLVCAPTSYSHVSACSYRQRPTFHPAFSSPPSDAAETPISPREWAGPPPLSPCIFSSLPTRNVVYFHSSLTEDGSSSLRFYLCLSPAALTCCLWGILFPHDLNYSPLMLILVGLFPIFIITHQLGSLLSPHLGGGGHQRSIAALFLRESTCYYSMLTGFPTCINSTTHDWCPLLCFGPTPLPISTLYPR